MAALVHLNLSGQGASGAAAVSLPCRELGDVPVPRAVAAHVPLSQVQVLDVSHRGLASLLVPPSSPLASVVARVTTLRLSHNALRSLHGVEQLVALEVLDLSHNDMRVFDAHNASLLRSLRRLRVLDLSYNALTMIDFAGSSNGGSSSSNDSDKLGAMAVSNNNSSGVQAMRVVVLNLSHNALLELPDVRCMPLLEVLNLDHNRIDDLADADVKLPLLALSTLQLRYNRLATLTSLVPLSALATTLRHLQLYGNPFATAAAAATIATGNNNNNTVTTTTTAATTTRSSSGRGDDEVSAGRWWWRPLLLWLMPRLATLDAVSFTAAERHAAHTRLFREHDTLSRRLVELLNARHGDELAVYVRRQCADVCAPADINTTVELLDEMDAADDAQLQQQQQPPPKEKTRQGSDADDSGDVDVSDSNKAAATAAAATATKAVAVVATASGDRGTASSSNSNSNKNNNRDASRSAHTRHDSVARSTITSVSTTTTTAAIATVVQAMQQKLQSLSLVVETLWRADVARRTRAAVVIQRHVRAARARAQLDDATRACCARVRQRLRRLASPRHCARREVHRALALHNNNNNAAAAAVLDKTTVDTSRRLLLLPPPRDDTDNSNSKDNDSATLSSTRSNTADANEGMREVVQAMRQLHAMLSDVYADLDACRAMHARERRRAAVRIQRAYRVHAARCVRAERQRSFDAFTQSLLPYVCCVQSAGRGYCARKRLAAATQQQQQQHVCSAEREVATLRGEVRALRALVVYTLRQQQQQQPPPPSSSSTSSSTPVAAAPRHRVHTVTTTSAPRTDDMAARREQQQQPLQQHSSHDDKELTTASTRPRHHVDPMHAIDAVIDRYTARLDGAAHNDSAAAHSHEQQYKGEDDDDDDEDGVAAAMTAARDYVHDTMHAVDVHYDATAYTDEEDDDDDDDDNNNDVKVYDYDDEDGDGDVYDMAHHVTSYTPQKQTR